MKRKNRPLGENQRYLLYSLFMHKSWRPGCGWLWNTPSGTKRLLDSLVRRGLVVKHDDGSYTLTADEHAKMLDSEYCRKLLRGEEPSGNESC